MTTESTDQDPMGVEGSLAQPPITGASDQEKEDVFLKPDLELLKKNKPSEPVGAKDKDVKTEPPKAVKSAKQATTEHPPLPYKEPKWGGKPMEEYSIEVLKNGQIVTTVDLKDKSSAVIGRLPCCDVHLEHPTLSRYHAVLQYCGVDTDRLQQGWYLYDLESTHGTTVNKVKLKPRVFTRIRVGHCMKFAGSTRLLILQGPDADAEEESPLTITELRERRAKEKIAQEIKQDAIREAREEIMKEEAEAKDDVTWGFADDAVEITSENPFALDRSDTLDLKDPKKTLKGFFENEGLDFPKFNTDEEGYGKHRCRVDLPVQSPNGENMFAEIVHEGRKKDAIVQCALEACKILDRMGLLRRSNHESRRKKLKDWSKTDYYDSDDDEYTDRTGDIERKRELRMRNAGKLNKKTETFSSLNEQLQSVYAETADIQKRLEQDKAETAALGGDGVDALDAYMSAIKRGCMDTKTKMKLKARLIVLKQDRLRLEKLLKIATPALAPTGADGDNSVVVVSPKASSHVRLVQGPALEKTDVTDDVKSESADLASVEQTVTSSRSPEGDQPADHTSPAPVTSRTDDAGAEPVSAMDTAPADGDEHDETVTRDQQPQESEAEHDTASRPPDTQAAQTDSVTSQESVPEAPADQADTGPVSKKKRRKLREREREKLEPKFSKTYCDNDPAYAVWMPPTDQSGDGKTSLNEKLGY